MAKDTDKYHFIGIGGIGMSGLARLLLNDKEKVEVTGSDMAASYVTEGLVRSGAKVYLGHSETHISSDMTVVYSSDIKTENPEYQAAISLKCPIMHRSDLLQKLMTGRKSLAVAGTHGKTTTTSLLTAVLMQANWHPSYMVGGIVSQMQSNSGAGKGEYFVVEADESDGTFLKYTPFGAIVTNIDNDHMNHFKTEENLVEAFKEFMGRVQSPQHLFWCGDDTRLRLLRIAGVSYGFNEDALLRATNFQQKGWGIVFDISFKGKNYRKVEVALMGRHNALNALAVFGLAIELGVPEEEIRSALMHFQGVGRRCEKKGEIQKITLIDDYAHHPTEIAVTLSAIRDAVKARRIVAVFQPHRYSRIQHCLGCFDRVFDDSDEVIVTDLYAAGEKPISGVSTEKVVEEIRRNHPRCRYLPRGTLAESLAPELRPHDVVVSLGAGDITRFASDLMQHFKHHLPKKLRVGVICGGCSSEHEVSLRSVRHILSSLNPDLYEIVQFGITKEGKWITSDDVVSSLQKEKGAADVFSPDVWQKLMTCDFMFPMLHGPNGEDGTIQGFFETLGKAYAGPDYRSAAVTMDKAITKKLMLAAGVSTSPFIDFSHHQWRTQRTEICSSIGEKLQYPVYVKPLHLGSTVGVSRAASEAELCAAVDKAFRVDTDVLVENEILGRELEFAVLGSDEAQVFPPGEIFTEGQTYDYHAKYSAAPMPTSDAAELAAHLIQEGMDFAFKAYRAAGCHGMARVDCFLDRQGKFWLNEINPIPGFTANSLYPKMCEKGGISGPELVDALVILGLAHHREKARFLA